ncbi:hypothetical protein [Corallococcus sp. RDP092CA]|uniref:hypothetical protein n=1 Tax=Corallococcus sp. RDP092CA TaxID=3109369 RepID=UPI0035B1A9AD
MKSLSIALSVLASLLMAGSAMSVLHTAWRETMELRVRIARSGLWALVPVAVWNAVLTSHLPVGVSDASAVPNALLVFEAVGRGFVFAAAALLPLGVSEPWQRLGLVVFVTGSVLYLLSWLPLLLDPTPSWWRLLPYALPFVWLLGLALMLRSRAYIAGSLPFVVAHVAHGALVTKAMLRS